MIKANGLGYERENQKLFSDLTFNVEPGEVLEVSGKNGSGKSSLLKILPGLCPPSFGSVVWQGNPIQSGDPEFLEDLLYIGHKLGLHPALTPLQNLRGFLELGGRFSLQNGDSIIAALQAVDLLGVQNLPCEALSRGQCQRLALARLWLNPPICWILDEPFTALDASGKMLLLEQFDKHLSQGGMIVLASHTRLDFGFSRVEKLELGRS